MDLRQPLVELANSKGLWERRIAVVSTQHFIRRGEFAETLAISGLLLGDGEDLIHKAFSGSGKALVLAALRGHVTPEERAEIQSILDREK